MICGNVSEITAEIVDLVYDTLVVYFGAVRDSEFDMIADSTARAMDGIVLPVKEDSVRSGKLAHKKLADEVFEGLVSTGIVKTQARKEALQAALRKQFFLYASTFKTKKALKNG